MRISRPKTDRGREDRTKNQHKCWHIRSDLKLERPSLKLTFTYNTVLRTLQTAKHPFTSGGKHLMGRSSFDGS